MTSKAKVYLVGGAVRDELLGREVQERDWVVVGSTPEEMTAQGYKPVGKDFPVFLHPETGEEYALARTERKTGKGYKGFKCHADPSVTLEDDLARRDFTINAIAKAGNGVLIDPFKGQDDIKARVFRHVSDAFVEDPLRILRGARFAARFAPFGFKVDVETMRLMQKMSASGELSALTPERVWKELSRALDEVRPSEFFLTLQRCGALDIVFPEIASLFGVPSSPTTHPEVDTGLHTMKALDVAASAEYDSYVRFAVLLHDVGKTLTPAHEWPTHTGHEAAALPLIEAFCEQYRVPKKYHDLALLVAQHHNTVHECQTAKPSEVVTLLERVDAFRRHKRFGQFCEACEADFRGRQGYEKSVYRQAEHLHKAYDLASSVDVKAIMQSGLTGMDIARELLRQRIDKVSVLFER